MLIYLLLDCIANNGLYSFSNIKTNTWDSTFWDSPPQEQLWKKHKKNACLFDWHHPYTINSIAHFTCRWDLAFHQFIFIPLPQTDAGALETSSNAVAFVSLPKTSSSMPYDLFLSATPRALALTRNTPHTALSPSLCVYHSRYHHTASISVVS